MNLGHYYVENLLLIYISATIFLVFLLFIIVKLVIEFFHIFFGIFVSGFFVLLKLVGFRFNLYNTTDLLCALSCLSSSVAKVTALVSFILLMKSLESFSDTSSWDIYGKQNI